LRYLRGGPRDPSGLAQPSLTMPLEVLLTADCFLLLPAQSSTCCALLSLSAAPAPRSTSRDCAPAAKINVASVFWYIHVTCTYLCGGASITYSYDISQLRLLCARSKTLHLVMMRWTSDDSYPCRFAEIEPRIPISNFLRLGDR
jgi:hypothetical protein